VSQVVERAGVHGFGVVSGLAAGIDAAGHQAALDRGVLTWAILGGGVDTPTPRENVGLAEAMIAAGGGLISEQAPGVEPNAARLVARNRLQVAASQVVVAAQSGIPSGTLHTVRFAIEQNKTLAVPRPKPPWDIEPQSAGNMALTDPDGCNPEVLSAKGSLADKIRIRRPAADIVLSDRSDIDRIWTSR
jgi:DNA processing protein